MLPESLAKYFPRSNQDPYFASLVMRDDTTTSREEHALELFERGYNLNASTPPEVIDALWEESRARGIFRNHRGILGIAFSGAYAVPKEILENLDSFDRQTNG